MDPEDLPVLMNARQLADLLGVNPATIWKWDRDGKLPRHGATGRSGRGSYWYTREEALRLLGGGAPHQMPRVL